MSDLAFLSALDLAAMIRSKEIGALELLDYFWERKQRLDRGLNAIIFDQIDEARNQARQADEAIAQNQIWGPLHGLPMTIKESFNWIGSPTTWGIPRLANNFPETNAIAIDRLTKAGANIFGKTNVPLLLSDWQSFNEIYGTTSSPWGKGLIPGGSSGGSAAALAAGLTGLELGSDIGASIRNPAHYCGVYGHKPTWEVVTPRGQALPGIITSTDIAVIGPMARSAKDLEMALKILAGPDLTDAVGWQLNLPVADQKKLSDFRVAIKMDSAVSEVDQEIQEQIFDLAQFLLSEGVEVDFDARPAFSDEEINDLYIMLLRSATSRRQTDEDYAANVSLVADLADQDQSYQAKLLRAYVMSHRDWLSLHHRRHELRLMWQSFFQDYDVLLCPAAASCAYPHDQEGERHNRTIEVNGKQVPTTDQLFWAGYSGVTLMPSTVAPAGLNSQGLPIGVQIIGAQYQDLKTIKFAQLLEQSYRGFVPPPGF